MSLFRRQIITLRAPSPARHHDFNADHLCDVVRYLNYDKPISITGVSLIANKKILKIHVSTSIVPIIQIVRVKFSNMLLNIQIPCKHLE